MAAQSSFDITSTVDLQEVDNAVNQARKEVTQRYDFKGSKASIDFKRAENAIDLLAEDNMKMTALWDILQTRLIRRGVPVKNLEASEPEPMGAGMLKRTVTLKQGIPIESAKKIVQFLKDHKLKKVQATIQSDQVRVASGSKDELQDAIRLLRGGDFGVELQFGNFR